MCPFLTLVQGSRPCLCSLRVTGARVVAIDPMTGKCPKEEKLDWVKGALPRLPFRDDSFNVVTCVSVLEHLDRRTLRHCYAELCRIARDRVILTFDLVLGPLARLGLFYAEFRAFERISGTKVRVPRDLLTPKGVEKEVCGPHIGVALFSIDRPRHGWPAFRLSAMDRMAVAVQTAIRKVMAYARSFQARLAKTQQKLTSVEHSP